jgi:hypothetical protein
VSHRLCSKINMKQKYVNLKLGIVQKGRHSGDLININCVISKCMKYKEKITGIDCFELEVNLCTDAEKGSIQEIEEQLNQLNLFQFCQKLPSFDLNFG